MSSPSTTDVTPVDDHDTQLRRAEDLAQRLEVAGQLQDAELIRRLLRGIKFSEDWHDRRTKRLWRFAHEELPEPQKTRYFNIAANGKADPYEP